MFFTQDDYKKIQQWLTKNSVKDTEFNEAYIPFKGNEIITIVQGSQNKKVFLKDLVAQIFNLGVSDFINVSEKYDAYIIDLEEAIRLIPSKARKKGQVITFLNKENLWQIYQFKGTLNQWNVLDQWEDLFANIIIDSILPDEEDLTKSLPDKNGNSYLSLKDREYNPEDFSGLGRIILRKNIVEVEDPIYGKVKKNVLYQDMFTQSNTIYEIRYDFDLNGGEIIIPENCVLDFQGGSMSNGSIVGNKTELKTSNKTIFYNMVVKGIWENSYVDSAYFDSYNEQTLINIMSLSSGETFTHVNIRKADIFIKGYINENIDDDYKTYSRLDIATNNILVPSNTCFDFNDGSLSIIPNSRNLYRALNVYRKSNVTIKNLNLIGDLNEHTFNDSSTSEWGHGLVVASSNNVLIENCISSLFIGDGFSVGNNNGEVEYGDTPILSTNVIMKNCKSINNRRQGLTIGGVDGVQILGCTFEGTGSINGTNPQAGIDIEPDGQQSVVDKYGFEVKDVLIDKCKFYNNVRRNIDIYSHLGDFVNITISNCVLENVVNGLSINTSERNKNVKIYNNDICGVVSLSSVNTLVENNQMNESQLYLIGGSGLISKNIINSNIFPFKIWHGSANSSYEVENNQIKYSTYFLRGNLESDTYKHNGGPVFRNNTIINIANSNETFFICNDFTDNTIIGLRSHIVITSGISENVSVINFSRNKIYADSGCRLILSKKHENDFSVNIKLNHFVSDKTNVLFAESLSVPVVEYDNKYNDAPAFIKSDVHQTWIDNTTIETKVGAVYPYSAWKRLAFYNGESIVGADGRTLSNIQGNSNQIPKSLVTSDTGYQFFLKYSDTRRCPIYYDYDSISDSYIWRYADGYIAVNSDGTINLRSGETINRPTGRIIDGFLYFDTTLGKPIWWIGNKWVDATGADV